MKTLLITSPYMGDTFCKLCNLELYKNNEYYLNGYGNEYPYKNVKKINDFEIKNILDSTENLHVLNDGFLNLEVIKYLQKLCVERNVTLNISNIDKSLDYSEYLCSINICHDYPTILICYDSKSAQIEYLDIVLHQIFKQNNINFRQFFSLESNRFFNAINTILDIDKVINHCVDEMAKIFIYSIPIDISNSEYTNVNNIIKQLVPDFVIYSTEYNNTNYKDIITYFKVFFGLDVDLIINSSYISAETIVETDCKVYISLTNRWINHSSMYKKAVPLDANDIEKIIFNEITSKLSYPHNVQRVL